MVRNKRAKEATRFGCELWGPCPGAALTALFDRQVSAFTKGHEKVMTRCDTKESQWR